MRPFNPLRKIFLHTVDEFEVDHVDGETMYFHKDGKLCKRTLHKSSVWHNGKKAEFITVGGIRYFAV